MTAPAATRGVTATDITVALGGRRVVRDVSLRVEPGSMLALVGPNGCGKSTLLSVLAGLRRPEHGTVLIDDRPVAKASSQELARLRSFVT